MKKTCLLLIAITALVQFSFAQTYSSLWNANSGTANWVNLGTINVNQNGNDICLKIYGGSGYNASATQMGDVELYLRTSNGTTVDANGYAFSAIAVAYGRAGSSFISQIRIVPNVSGASATAYTIYAYCGNFLGGSFYVVESLPLWPWTSSNTIVSTVPDGYSVPFEYFLDNDAFIMGHLCVNTADTKGYQFAVNGSAVATSMTVKAYSNWPDYVLKKNYTLPSLTELKTFIDKNHHLPEIPSKQQIAKDGLNLGEMNKLLVKKVEELTLYLIELKDENDALKQNQKAINTKLKRHHIN